MVLPLFSVTNGKGNHSERRSKNGVLGLYQIVKEILKMLKKNEEPKMSLHISGQHSMEENNIEKESREAL